MTYEEPDAGTEELAMAPRVVEQRGLWFEEFQPGVVYRHRPGRTLTEADNVLFTTLTMNTQGLHLDAAYAEGQPFGQRLVNSMLTLATMVGQSVSQLTQGTLVAQLGLEHISFPHPLFLGDTLSTETEVVDKRPSSSRPGQGIVTLAHTGRNQAGEVVGRCTRTALVWTRAAGEDESAGGAAGSSGEQQGSTGERRNSGPEGSAGAGSRREAGNG